MMTDLMANFKSGHQSMVSILGQTQPLIRSYKEARPHIRKMQEILMTHFARQDDGFFRELRLHYESDRQATKLIEFLIHDLKDIKIKFLIFFDKYTGEMGDSGSKTFPKDFAEFSGDILGRIKIEKDYLLPLIEKLPA